MCFGSDCIRVKGNYCIPACFQAGLEPHNMSEWWCQKGCEKGCINTLTPLIVTLLLLQDCTSRYAYLVGKTLSFSEVGSHHHFVYMYMLARARVCVHVCMWLCGRTAFIPSNFILHRMNRGMMLSLTTKLE